MDLRMLIQHGLLHFKVLCDRKLTGGEIVQSEFGEFDGVQSYDIFPTVRQIFGLEPSMLELIN